MKILVNGHILSSLNDFNQEIRSISVVSIYPLLVERPIAVVIASKLHDACTRCTGVITYNGVIIPKEDIKEPVFN